ncbi:MAG TPA: MFS transporter [Steroidobacteraceae bacterium]|nr:MFS transporter [Steroidobacteraceae bacterium]
MLDGLPTPRRYLAILAVSFGTGLAVLDGSIVTVALPTMARDLHVESSTSVLVVTIYQLTLVMTLLPLSALGSHLGLRRVYQCGQLIFLLSTALCFFARSMPFLLVVRTIQALGAGAALSVSSALIRSIYPSRQLGLGLGISGVVVSVAGVIAPTLGGLVLSVARWPWIFVAACPFALVSLLVGRHSLPDALPSDEPFDVLGAVLCAATFGLTISGLESLVHGDSPVIAGFICVLGLGLAVVFVRRELHSKRPILPVDLLTRPIIGLSAIGGLVAFMGSTTMIFSIPFRLQQQFGWLPLEVGAVIAPWPAAMAFAGFVAGILSDRFPAGILGAIGMLIAVCGMLLLAFLPQHPTHFDMVWRMALCGCGYGLFLSPNSRLIIHAASRERAASAGGLVGTTRLTGQTLGATLLAALLAAGVGRGPAPALAAASLALTAGVCSIARLRAAAYASGQASVQEI